jgi:hypothetical protein
VHRHYERALVLGRGSRGIYSCAKSRKTRVNFVWHARLVFEPLPSPSRFLAKPVQIERIANDGAQRAVDRTAKFGVSRVAEEAGASRAVPATVLVAG